MLSEGTTQTVIDPNTKVLYPVDISFDNGLVTMKNKNGMTFEIFNVQIKFDTFELAASIDKYGNAYDTPQVLVTTNCNNIKFYGQFLKELGFCNLRQACSRCSGQRCFGHTMAVVSLHLLASGQ
jgi:hypothetical protein